MNHVLINRDEIDGVYREVLGRPVDQAGLDHFGSLIVPYKMTKGRLMYILAGSEEFANRDDDSRNRVLSTIKSTVHPAERLHWFHSIRLSDGFVTNGMQQQDQVAELVFKHSVRGKSVLDIGAWDGYYSFEAERRGASDVLATDWFCWGGPGWGTKAGFDFAHAELNSKVRTAEVDLFQLDPAQHGTFDVVLFLGVLYHLVDPLGGLRKAAEMAADQLIVFTHTRNNGTASPSMAYVEGLNGDDTTYWYPNLSCITAILEKNGFTRFETLEGPVGPENGEPRHLVHAFR
ncbi:class I SAM-dependent methyltransferase [Rhodopseudomonas sp. NSM]|uniref:class I SAM-dependent methyltransferase n=1 Tax=Rhodopseudomonas sp. NSM TaxID=3457630 RepID=UPI004036AD81